MFFGDADPDDAYDASDTIAERLANIDRRLRWFTDDDAGPHLAGPLADRLTRVRDDLATIRVELVDAVERLAGGGPVPRFTRP